MPGSLASHVNVAGFCCTALTASSTLRPVSGTTDHAPGSVVRGSASPYSYTAPAGPEWTSRSVLNHSPGRSFAVIGRENTQ